MKRMTVCDFVRVQGIGKTRIRLRGKQREEITKNRKEDGTGFQRIFDTEMKRLDGENGESEETNKGTERADEKISAEMGELAGTMPGEDSVSLMVVNRRSGRKRLLLK